MSGRKPVRGDILVPKGTPPGNWFQRRDWAYNGNGYLTVYDPDYQGKVAYFFTAREFPKPGMFGEPWGVLLERYEFA